MFSKVCSFCKKTKQTSEFHKHSNSRDGLRGECRACISEKGKQKRLSTEKVSIKEAEAFVQKLEDQDLVFKCRRCGHDKTAREFYYQRDNGKVRIATSKCKQCQLDYQMEKTFGMTVDHYEHKLKQQNHRCAICLTHIDEYSTKGYRNRFAVDHCHSTNRIRGLLCDLCNRGLGLFKEEESRLLSAVEYLKEWKNV